MAKVLNLVNGKINKGQSIALTIDKAAYGGSGIGRINGYVVFVRGAIPGDRISAQIIRKKKDYAEARILEILSPSPDRVSPPCPYSGYCGGCQWQHLHYAKQLAYKKEQIQEAMERIGNLKDVVIRDVLPSDNLFAYRNKMEFSFSDRRWFLPSELDRRESEGGFALGLHVPGTYNKVIDMEGCLLQQERGNQILREVKRYARASGIPVYGLKTHKGFWRFLMVRYSNASDAFMVNLVTAEHKPEVVQPLADILLSRIGRIKTVVNNISEKKAAIAIGDYEIILGGDGYIKDRIGPFDFHISANSFFQTNSLAAAKLYQKVVDYAVLKGNETVLDLYSGTGTIPVFLANRVGSVTGIELSKSAVMDARRNCKENGIQNCCFVQGDIRKAFTAITSKPDVLIIDPPRAGMHKDVLAHVLTLLPEKIIYISCNPTTMARDMGQMIRNYHPVEIQPVDMFPHTYHIEAVAKLVLRKKV